MQARLTLAAGLILVAIAVGAVLSQSPDRRIATNWHATPYFLAITTAGDGAGCQGGELLPAGASAMRLSLTSQVGPRVSVRALSDGRVLTRGAHAAGWTGYGVTVALHPVPRTASKVTVCFSIGHAVGAVGVLGAHAPPARSVISGANSIGGAIRIDYLQPGQRSWWSRATAVARRMGLGRAWAGTWVAGFVLALMASAVALMSRLVIREQVR
ncbi:MAG TPA: hypothetical protein VLJ42_08110 [Solirubrobacteraceae bacterium]|nr:hypothetical protein [Solirubrobacteraceae bacterium]